MKTISSLHIVTFCVTLSCCHQPIRSTEGKVTVQPKNQTQPAGVDITFDCSEINSTGDATYNVDWTKEGGVLSPRAWQARGVLTNTDIKEEDSGVYVCTGYNLYSDRVTLTVDCPDDGWPSPRVRVSPRYQMAQRNSTVRFDCHAAGTPAPRINWTFSEGQLPLGWHVDGGLLTLPLVNERYDGTYTCNATNVHGSAQSTGSLAIEPDIIPTAHVEPQNTTFTQGEKVMLWCITTGSPPPTVTWSKIGGQFPSRTAFHKQAMIIPEAKADDRGLYMCRAENSRGAGKGSTFVEIETRKAVVVEIYPKASQVVEGDGSQFQCKLLAGVPYPTLRWTRADGKPFVNKSTQVLEDGVIRFSRTTRDEDGTYICTAENKWERVVVQAVLRVQIPVNVAISSPMHVIDGRKCKDVVINCRDAGPSRLPVKWFRPDGKSLANMLEVGDGLSTLRVSKVEYEGFYTCSIEGYSRSETIGNYASETYLKMTLRSVACLLERLEDLIDRLNVNESITCNAKVGNEFKRLVESLEYFTSNYASDQTCLFLD